MVLDLVADLSLVLLVAVSSWYLLAAILGDTLLDIDFKLLADSVWQAEEVKLELCVVLLSVVGVLLQKLLLHDWDDALLLLEVEVLHDVLVETLLHV